MEQANPFFSEHAAHYARSRGHAAGEDLARLVVLVGARPGLLALDVGTGTGHTALALADAGAEVVGLDPTPAMLEQARALAVAGAHASVRFVEGTAEALPFPDGSFDIVTCRRAAHHFRDIPTAVREMTRVLRPGGRLGIVDLCPEAQASALWNRLERLRDHTHAEALDEAAWRQVVRGVGLDIAAEEISTEDQAFEVWLAPVPPDGPQAGEIRSALAQVPVAERLRAGLAEGRPWRKRRILLCAVRRG